MVVRSLCYYTEQFRLLPAVGPHSPCLFISILIYLAQMKRVIYTARLADAIYVLHAFQKKTQATSKQDIELAATRFAALIRRNR